jgi:hypothetical protein
VSEAAQILEIEDLLKKRPRELSGGKRRRPTQSRQFPPDLWQCWHHGMGESLADMKTLDRWRDSVGLAYGDRERRQPSLGEPAQPTASKSPMRP